MGDSLFGESVSRITQALNWNIKRQKMISSNIANLDTPRYKAMDLDFQKMMEGIFDNTGMALERTNKAHFPTSQGGSSPVFVIKNSKIRLDGNTVDLSKEVAHMVENNLLYQTLAKSLKHHFQMINTAIKS